MEILSVRVQIPERANLILGQSHFIKTAEDLFEVIVNTVPGAKFAVAFNEASGPCLVPPVAPMRRSRWFALPLFDPRADGLTRHFIGRHRRLQDQELP